MVEVVVLETRMMEDHLMVSSVLEAEMVGNQKLGGTSEGEDIEVDEEAEVMLKDRLHLVLLEAVHLEHSTIIIAAKTKQRNFTCHYCNTFLTEVNLILWNC